MRILIGVVLFLSFGVVFLQAQEPATPQRQRIVSLPPKLQKLKEESKELERDLDYTVKRTAKAQKDLEQYLPDSEGVTLTLIANMQKSISEYDRNAARRDKLLKRLANLLADGDSLARELAYKLEFPENQHALYHQWREVVLRTLGTYKPSPDELAYLVDVRRKAVLAEATYEIAQKKK